jgi:hypothetical protein
MRLLNLERLELAELTATRRGLVETVSELCWFHGHGEPGRPRRVISEVLRASQGLVGDALEAVRGDELLEQGWRSVKSDWRPPPLRPFLATHARVRGFFMRGVGSNSPPLVLESGWSPKGSDSADGAAVAETMLELLDRRF